MNQPSLTVDQGVRPSDHEPALTQKHKLRADIQALRGLAILLVLFQHARVPGFPGGFLGVDIFFVISGYLMTGLIDEALVERRFTLRSFYIRRVRRLFPASYATLVVTAIAAPFLLESFEHHQFVTQLIGAFTFTANFVLWKQADYFNSYAGLKPLLHMWSLSIEEQFYLFLPVAMMVCGRRARLWLALVCVIASAAFCFTLRGLAPSAMFYMLPSRAWELGIGTVVALLVRREIVGPGRYVAIRLACTAVLLLVPLLFDERNHPGYPALAVCLATAMLLVPGANNPRLDAIMAPITKIGDRSYSLYLVHWPVFAFANNVFLGEVPLAIDLALLPLCVLWSELQFRLIEQRFRRFAITRRSILVLVLIPVLTIGGSMAWSAYIAHGAIDRAPARGLSGKCAYRDRFTPSAACQTAPNPRILVWGDSFAMQLVPGLIGSTTAPLAQATKEACGPLLGLAPENGAQQSLAWAENCNRFNQSVVDYLAKTPSIQLVVLSSPFVQYIPGGEDIPWRAVVRTKEGITERPLSFDLAVQALGRTVAAIRAAGKRAVLIAPPPSTDLEIPHCLDRRRLGLLTITPYRDCRFTAALYEQQRRPVLQFLKMVEDRNIVPILRLDGFLCQGGICRTEIDGVALYHDRSHLNPSGSRLIGERMQWGKWIETHAR